MQVDWLKKNLKKLSDLTTRVNLVRNLSTTKELPVSTSAKLLGINRTSVYYEGLPVSQEELECKSIIDHLHMDNLPKTRMTGRRRRKNGVMIEQHFYFCSRIVLFMIKSHLWHLLDYKTATPPGNTRFVTVLLLYWYVLYFCFCAFFRFCFFYDVPHGWFWNKFIIRPKAENIVQSIC